MRKEKGDQNPESPNTVKPIWRQDLSKYFDISLLVPSTDNIYKQLGSSSD